MTIFKSTLASVVSAGLILIGTPGMASASMIGTEAMVVQAQRADTEARLQTLLSRDDVQNKLVAWGVDVEKAKTRASAMSDQEIAQVSQTLDMQPAGGDGLVIVGIVFVVLLILELVGVTNVFTKF